MRQRDFAQARLMAAQLEMLVRDDMEADRLARLLSAEVLFAAGDLEAALAKVGPDMASRRPELVLSSEIRLRLSRPGDAVQGLQAWVAKYPQDARAWQLLASAEHALNQPLRALRAEAEAQAAHLDYAAAVDRLKAGQDLSRSRRGADDYVDASIIDTRLREMQSLLREQAAER
jgi:beta-barrel assembly-enhancing protease